MNRQEDNGLGFVLGMLLVMGIVIPAVFALAPLLGFVLLFNVKYIALALLAYAAWRFLRWYVPQVRQEHRRLTAPGARSTPPARREPPSGTVMPRVGPWG